MYTPTYRYAINWLNKNKDTIDLAVDLLNIHPSLINQDSCIKLRHFMARSKNSNMDVKLEIDPAQNEVSGSALPEILVSEVPDQTLNKVSKTPRLCVCGDIEADKWHRLLVSLCCKYSVTCVPTDIDCRRFQAEADLFVFLLDSKSSACDKSNQTLRQAYLSNTAVVFVRDMEFDLYDMQCVTPTKLCNLREASDLLKLESLLKGNDVSPVPSLTPSPTKYIHKSLGLFGSGRNLYSCSSLSRSIDSGIGRSACSSRTSFSPTKTANLLNVDDSHMSESDFQKTAMTDDERINISKLMNSQCGSSSLSYHHLYHDTCIDRINTVIEQKLLANRGAVNQSDRTSSSMSLSSNPESTVRVIGSATTPEPRDKINWSKRRRSVTFVDEKPRLRRGSIPTETVFLLSDPLSEDSPVVVHWPKDFTKQSISNSSSIDSFGFQEVDLSKQVNELDLFTDSEYE